MTIERDEAQMLAALAVRCRPTGARQWQEADVMAEIGKLRSRSLSSVVLAVIRAASDKGAVRPEVIGSAGSHWGDTMLPSTPPATAPVGTRCTVCGGLENAVFHNAGLHPYSPPRERMDPDANHAAALAARQHLAPTSGPSERRGPEDFAAADPELHANVEAARDQITQEEK